MHGTFLIKAKKKTGRETGTVTPMFLPSQTHFLEPNKALCERHTE